MKKCDSTSTNPFSFRRLFLVDELVIFDTGPGVV